MIKYFPIESFKNDDEKIKFAIMMMTRSRQEDSGCRSGEGGDVRRQEFHYCQIYRKDNLDNHDDDDNDDNGGNDDDKDNDGNWQWWQY